MTAFASIRSCQELDDTLLTDVVESRDDVRMLLEHLAAIARPGEGGPRVLLLFAKLATPACEWLEGALQIELHGDAKGTSIESFAVIGAGLRERVVPRVVMPVLLGEFLDVVGRFPHLLAPLAVVDVSGTHVVLAAKEAERREMPSELPDEDEEAEEQRRSRPSREPSVARRLPPPPRVPLPVVMAESASKSVPPRMPDAPPRAPSNPPMKLPARPLANPPARAPASPPASPPAKRTQVAVAVARIAKPQAKPKPIEDERRGAPARRHPAAEPSLAPPPVGKPAEPPPEKPAEGEEVDEGWE